MKNIFKNKGTLAIIILLIVLIIAVIVATIVIVNSKKEEKKETNASTNSIAVNEVKDSKETDTTKTNKVTNQTATQTSTSESATTTTTTTTNSNTSTNASTNSNTNTQTPSNTTTNNTSDKNYLYVGTTNNFKTYEVSINKDLEVVDQAEALIRELGFKIGYQIMIKDITSGKGGMTVNFDKDSAPFDITSTYRGNGEEEYKISDKENVAKTIFDSIKETLQKYFGATMDIYLQKDDGDIEINSIKINSNEPYKGS